MLWIEWIAFCNNHDFSMTYSIIFQSFQSWILDFLLERIFKNSKVCHGFLFILNSRLLLKAFQHNMQKLFCFYYSRRILLSLTRKFTKRKRKFASFAYTHTYTLTWYTYSHITMRSIWIWELNFPRSPFLL